jgi:hypothetical protein
LSNKEKRTRNILEMLLSSFHHVYPFEQGRLSGCWASNAGLKLNCKVSGSFHPFFVDLPKQMILGIYTARRVGEECQ